MPSAKTHPHIDQPSDAALEALVKDKAPAIRQIYVDAHRLVRETLPDVTFSVDEKDATIGYGAGQYGYGGWGMAALAPFTKWISIGFLKGASLDDATRILEGTGKAVRHVKLRTPDELAKHRHALKRLLKAAARANRD
jgi:hypothetical protein